MDTTKVWDYRVFRKITEDGLDEWYSIQEVYYDECDIEHMDSIKVVVDNEISN